MDREWEDKKKLTSHQRRCQVSVKGLLTQKTTNRCTVRNSGCGVNGFVSVESCSHVQFPNTACALPFASNSIWEVNLGVMNSLCSQSTAIDSRQTSSSLVLNWYPDGAMGKKLKGANATTKGNVNRQLRSTCDCHDHCPCLTVVMVSLASD